MEFRAYVSFWPMEWFKLLRYVTKQNKNTVTLTHTHKVNSRKYINTTITTAVATAATIVEVYSRITEKYLVSVRWYCQAL